MEFKRREKCAIVGTAQTWKETPWNDTSLDIWTLNDAYMLGMPRIDVHFEQHPLDMFVYRKHDQKVFTHADIPAGHYLRPEGHLEWLKKKADDSLVITKEAPPADWAHAMQYPREAMEKEFADFLWVDKTWDRPYASSGPLWMMLLAISMGYKEIQIYGIHLATEREYVEQRPNFEGIIYYAIGKGIKIHLPKTAPICKGTHVYCYEKRYSQERDALRHHVSVVDQKRAKVTSQLLKRPWWKSRGPLEHRMLELDADRAELASQLGRIDFAETLERPEWRVS